MIGLYDPRSLTRTKTGFEIAFVNATNASERRMIPIRTREDANAMTEWLKAQLDRVACPFHAAERQMIRLQGTIMFPPGSGEMGLIAVPRDSGRQDVLAFNPLFGRSSLPAQSVGFAFGFMEEDIFHAALVVAKSMDPAPRDPPAATVLAS